MSRISEAIAITLAGYLAERNSICSKQLATGLARRSTNDAAIARFWVNTASGGRSPVAGAVPRISAAEPHGASISGETYMGINHILKLFSQFCSLTNRPGCIHSRVARCSPGLAGMTLCPSWCGLVLRSEATGLDCSRPTPPASRLAWVKIVQTKPGDADPAIRLVVPLDFDRRFAKAVTDAACTSSLAVVRFQSLAMLIEDVSASSTALAATLALISPMAREGSW